ncbi:MAG: hypothetical protein IPM60_13105 [Rhodospirillales bacterium]|nr:hypothetical protein [Rhodospirillales bacterium]
MSNVVKYRFERSFEHPAPTPPHATADADVVVLHEEPAAPVFSQEDVTRAYADGVAEGVAQGRREAEALAAEDAEQRIAGALAMIGERLAQTLSAAQASDAAIARQATALATAIVDKLLPDLSRRGALGEIARVTGAVMGQVLDQPKLTITVAGALREAVAERIQALAGSRGFAGQVDVVADDAMAAGDCRIAWAGGGACRDVAALRASIDAIITDTIGTPEAAHLNR